MRQIKVRFWDEENKKFWHGGDEGESIGEECFQSFFIKGDLVGMMGESINVGCGEYDFRERKLPSSQYTGLSDKDGLEIYEGDILKNDRGLVLKVYYAGGSILVNGITSKGNELDDFLHTFNSWSTIIGNIYENPELLSNLDTLKTQ